MTMMFAQAAPAPPKITTECDIASIALAWGHWFIVLAFVAAVVLTVASAIAAFRPPSEKTKVVGDKDWLDSLKGVLEALAKLPNWVAVLLAGLALLWIARDSAATCAAPKPSTPPAAGKATGQSGQQPAQPQQNQVEQNQAAH